MPRVGDHLGNGAKRQEQSTVDSHQTGVLYGVTALARRTSSKSATSFSLEVI